MSWKFSVLRIITKISHIDIIILLSIPTTAASAVVRFGLELSADKVGVNFYNVYNIGWYDYYNVDTRYVLYTYFI